MTEHSPAPVPTRGVYGFALYLASTSAFVAYIVWAFIPDELLHALGITYYPQKYWAIALPVYALMCLALFAYFFYPALNQLLSPPLDSNDTITDKFAQACPDSTFPAGDKDRVPPAYDLHISHVSSVLYKRRRPK